MESVGESAKDLLVFYSKEYGIDVPHSICSRFSAGACLDLQRISLAEPICLLLGKCLQNDYQYTDVALSDSVVGDEGIRAFIQGISNNNVLRFLNLKGNNIRGNGTIALGAFLKQTSSLESLSLDWNDLGADESAFSIFAEALAVNRTLGYLDVSNNKISHIGAANLATALVSNTTLFILDLRYNSIGLKGANSLLGMLKHNCTLSKLSVEGNGISLHLLASIDTLVSQNDSHLSVISNLCQQRKTLSDELSRTNAENAFNIGALVDAVAAKEIQIRHSLAESAVRVEKLEGSIAERNSSFNVVAEHLESVQSELRTALQDVHKLTAENTKLKKDIEIATEKNDTKMKRVKQEHQTKIDELIKSTEQMEIRLTEIQQSADEKEGKFRSQQDEIYRLSEQIAHVKNECCVNEFKHQEAINAVKTEYREKQRKDDLDRQKQIDRINFQNETERSKLQDKIFELEGLLTDAKEEVAKMKQLSISDKIAVETRLSEIRHRLKLEEEQKLSVLEDKIIILSSSKEELEKHSQQQTLVAIGLQTENKNLTIENDSLKRKIESMTTILGGKEAEKEAEVGKMEDKLKDMTRLLNEERKTVLQLEDKLKKLSYDISELQRKHGVQRTEKDTEITSLRERLKQLEKESLVQKEVEESRANLLKSYINKFITRAAPFDILNS